MDIMIHRLMPAILTIGLLALGIKYYLHFMYFKIVKGYPKELSFWSFKNSMFSYFRDNLCAFLPFFIKNRKESELGDLKKVTRLKKFIIVCLILFYLGVTMISIGIILQGKN